MFLTVGVLGLSNSMAASEPNTPMPGEDPPPPKKLGSVNNASINFVQPTNYAPQTNFKIETKKITMPPEEPPLFPSGDSYLHKTNPSSINWGSNPAWVSLSYKPGSGSAVTNMPPEDPQTKSTAATLSPGSLTAAKPKIDDTMPPEDPPIKK